MATTLQETNVMQTVRGVYEKGHVELLDKPVHIKRSAVLVTFITGKNGVDLRRRGVLRDRAADLRGRLKSFAMDWERPEMDAYDTL